MVNRKIKVSITFIISLIISYFIVGYLKSNIGVAICWIEDVTVIQKLNEYYIRTFGTNIILATILALIPTFIVIKLDKR